MAENRGIIKTKSPATLNWFKNVGKSLGYTTLELVEQMMPASIEFTKSNAQSARELYTEMRSMKSQGKRLSSLISSSEDIGIAKTALKNALEDIKSGRIYNKERQESVYNDGMEEFSLEEFDMGEDADIQAFADKGITPTINKTINVTKVDSPITKNNPMVKAIDRQTESIIKTAQATNQVSVSIASSAMLSNKKFNSQMMQGLNAINDNLSLLVNFQSESMTKYIGASLKYYEDNLKIMNETLTELRKATNPPPAVSPKVGEDPRDMAFLARGGLNLKGYGQLVWKQLGNAIDSNMFLAPIKSMLNDKDTLKYLAASPLSFISTRIVSFLIPGMLKKAMEDMDKTFESFFPAMLMKVNRWAYKSDNPILQMIGQIFGIQTKTKSTVDLSQYHKGSTPFDGYTKKAITEVIPGYLRKILAVLSGKEEMAFDYDQGVFKTAHSMKNDFDDRVNRDVLNQFSDALNEIKDRTNAFYIQDVEERTKFQKEIKKFFLQLSKTNYLVNPNRTRDKEGNKVDELSEVYDFGNNADFQKFFRQMVMSLPKNLQTRMFGTDVLNARKTRERIMNEAEQDPLKYNTSTIYNQLGFDQHLTRDSKNPSVFQVKPGSGIQPTDKYGNSSLNYLRDIKKILLDGIVVYPRGDGSGGSGGVLNGPASLKTRLEGMTREERAHQLKSLKSFNYRDMTNSQIEQKRAGGQRVISSLTGSDLSDNEISSQIDMYVSQRDMQPTENQKDNIFKWIGKVFKGGPKERYEMIREKVEGILQKPAQVLTGVFKKIDDTMYHLIFGKKEGENEPSFLTKTVSILKSKFNEVTTWLKDQVFTPVKEALFGKDGLITKMKNSDFYKSLKGNLGKMADYLFGKPGGENGKREGGLFSQTANEMLDIWDGAKYYFTGKAYTNRAGVSFAGNEKSVFGEMKSMFRGFKDNIKEYIFGKKGEDGKTEKTSVFSSIFDQLSKGFQNFADAIFGPKKIGGKDNKNYETIHQLTAKIKQRAPKALASGIVGAGAGLFMGGKLGLLGSLFLPGGPVGGAIVGTTIGFLTQSDRFKNWLFGPKDANGERIGGFVGKKTQEFFKKNKSAMIGGAALGALKPILGFGLLPSFFLPGGPVGGAIMGMGMSMLTKSEWFQKMMFGEKQEDGTRVGGIVTKLFGKFREGKNKNLFGNMGAGALGGAGLGLIMSKMGLMGAMLLPGGPIGGALLGAAAGIALSSEKWKKVLFGEFDEDTQLRKGGLFGKFINWTKLEVLAPLKLKFKEINLNIQEWFAKSIANPFMNALAPIKHELSNAIKGIKDNFVEGWKSFKGFLSNMFEKHVGMPFGQFMKKNVMDPLKGFFSRILNGIGKILGSVISAPFKGLEGMSRGLTKKHMQQGLEAYIADGWKDVMDFKGRRQRGEKLGFFGGLKKIAGLYFDKDARNDARRGEKGAPYLDALEKEKAEREAKQNAEFASKRAAIDAERQKLNLKRSIGLKYDYENLTENGVNISRIYGNKGQTSNFKGSSGSESAPTATPNTQSQSPSNPVEEANQKIADQNKVPQASTDEKETGSKSTGSSKSTQSPSTSSRSTSENAGDGARTSGRNISPSGATTTKGGKSQIQLVSQIAGDVRTIAQEVKGQLDGVGGNVFKIRKLMQKQAGASDEDLSGSGNKDRIGFLGRIRRALYKPLDAIKETLMKPVKWVGEKLRKVGEGLKKAGEVIIQVPKKIIQGVWNFGKELLNIGKETFLSIIKLPGQLIGALGNAAKIAVESLKMVGPGIAESLKGVARLFSGALGMAAHAMIGFGQGVGEIFKGMGEAIGKTISGVAGALWKAVPMLTNFMFSTAKIITDFTFKTVKMVGEKLLDVGKSLFEIVTSPIKFLAGAVGKIAGKTNEVTLAGGTIDLVKEVQVVKAIGADSNKFKTLSDKSVEPMPVRIVASDICVPVYLCPDKIASSFAKIFPIPVSISSDGTTTKTFKSGKGKATGMGGSLLDALNIFDEQDDKEEANKVASSEEQAKLAARQKEVTKKTAGFLLGQKAISDEKKFAHDNETKQTSLLEKIANTTKEHKDGFLSMFGTKGLITLAVLAVLPFLKDIAKYLLGFGNSARTDVGGTTIINQDLAEHGVRGASYLAQQVNKKVIQPVVKTGRTIADVGSKGFQFAKKGYDKAKAWATKTAHVDDALAKASGETAEETAEKAAKTYATRDGRKFTVKAAGEGEKIAKVSVEGTEAVVDAVKKTQVGKMKKMIAEVMEKLFKFFEGKLGKSCTKAFAKISERVGKIFTEKAIFKFLPKLMAGAAKIAGAASTLFLSDAAFATWGAISGAVDAAHLFKVHGDQVDWKMRLISGAIKALLSVSWFFLIEIINDIVVELTGIDFIEMISTALYKAMSDDEDDVKLENAQTQFKNDREAYNKANGTNLSLDAYNDKVNETLGAKIGGGFKWVGGKIADGASWVGGRIADGAKATWQGAKWLGGKVAQGTAWLGGKIADGAKATWEGAKWAGGKIADGAKWVGGKIADGASWVKDKAVAAKDWVADKAKSAFNNSFLGAGLKGLKDDEAIKKNLHLKGDGKITAGMRVSSGASEVLENISFGLLKSEKTAKFIYGLGLRTQEFFGNVQKAAGEAWGKVTKFVGGVTKSISDKASEIWGGISKTAGDAWAKVSETVGGAVDSVKSKATEIWNGITDDVKKKWDAAKKVVGGALDVVKSKATEIWDDISTSVSEKFTAAKDFVGNAVTSIKDKASDIWGGITNSVSEKWDAAKDFVGNAVTSIKDKTSEIWGNLTKPVGEGFSQMKESIFKVKDKIVSDAKEKWETISKPLGQAWDTIKSNITGAVDKVKGFFGNVLDGVKGVFGKVGDKIKSGWDSFVSFFTGAADTSIENQGWDGGNGPLPLVKPKKNQKGGFGDPNSMNNFAYYSQSDSRWANFEYDHSPNEGTKSSQPFIKNRGCGPTSMAMVLTQLTGQRYEPPQLAKYAQQKGYSGPQGTTWGFFDSVAKDFSLQMSKVEPKSNRASIQNWLANGMPVILSGNRSHNPSESPFTPGGHYVVAVANDGNGNILINDPRGPQYSKSYDLNTVLSESKQAWAFKYGGGPMPAPLPTSDLGGNVAGSGKLSILDLFGKMSENFGLYVDNVFQGSNKGLDWAISGAFNPGNAANYANYQTYGDPYGMANKKLNKFEPITEQMLNDWIEAKAPAGSPFRGQGRVFLDASKESGLDPRYIVAHAALESAWGTSRIARDKNNYFGIGAFNDSPYASAHSFGSGLASGIIGGANWISKNYTNRGQDTLNGMILGDPKHRYAVYDDGRPNTGWIESIAKIMATAPKGGGNGFVFDPASYDAGGFGEVVDGLNNKVNSLMTNDGKIKADGIDFSTLSKSSPEFRAYLSGGNKDCMTDELLKQALTVLHEISDNTGSTSEGIKTLAKKEFNVHVTTNGGNGDKDQKEEGDTTIVLPEQKNYINPMIEIANERRASKPKNDYVTAKTIAKGRTN